MIDTVKIYCAISKELYTNIHNKSIVKSSIDLGQGEILYEITTGYLEGSYSSKLSVHTDCCGKYVSLEDNYYIEIEGSYHKITKGYNSHDGIYNLMYIVKGFIQLAENSYNIKLPPAENWYLQRVDIAKCYDIGNQKNVCEYINSLCHCQYARRNLKLYSNDGVYVPGTTTTLKIYNKLSDFKKHDQKKFKGTDFKLINYINHIDGFVRFEVEIKKKSLQKLVGKDIKNISVKSLEYKDLEKFWSDEFMKLLGMFEEDLKIVRGKETVKSRLLYLYGNAKGMRLFNFYCSIQMNGLDFVKKDMSSSVYYRNIKELKEARIDYSQMYEFKEVSTYWFNPFEFEEVV